MNEVKNIYVSAPESIIRDPEANERLKECEKHISLSLAAKGIRCHTYLPQCDNRELFYKNRQLLRKICDQVILAADLLYVPYRVHGKWQKKDLITAKEAGVPILCDRELLFTLRDYEAKEVGTYGDHLRIL